MKVIEKNAMFVLSLVCAFATVSCSQKQIDKSKYDKIFLSDERLVGNVELTNPTANSTSFFYARVVYLEPYNYVSTINSEANKSLSPSQKKASDEWLINFLGLDKKVIFTDVGDSNAITFFTVKNKFPDLSHRQIATIYFRMERKEGKVVKLEIELIEK